MTEITSWRQRTRFHVQLLGSKVDELEPAYQLPNREGGENDLLEICEKVERVLLDDMNLLRCDGSEERKLSTFRSDETSQVGQIRPATTRTYCKASGLHSLVRDCFAPRYFKVIMR